jgi:hypothetical protein
MAFVMVLRVPCVFATRQNAFRPCVAQERSQCAALGMGPCIGMAHICLVSAGDIGGHGRARCGWKHLGRLVKQGSVVFFLVETNES